MVAAACRHDDILTRGHGLVVSDFWIWIGQGKDDGVGRHGLDHGCIHKPAFAQAQKHVRPLHGLRQVGELHVRGVLLLAGIQAFASGMDVAAAVKHRRIRPLHAELLVNVEARHGRGSCTTHHDADVFNLLVCQLEGIDQGRRTDDRGAVLIVVHQGDVELLLQTALNLKRLRGLDVFQVDAAKRGCNRLDRGHKLVDICGVHLDVKHIDVREHFEQNAFPLHHGLARLGTNVPQTKHCGAVADDRHEVALGGVGVDVLWVFCDRLARLCHPRAVGQAEVPLRAVRFGRDHLHLPPPFPGVVFEGLSLQIVLLHEWTKFTTKVARIIAPSPKDAHHDVHKVMVCKTRPQSWG